MRLKTDFTHLDEPTRDAFDRLLHQEAQHWLYPKLAYPCLIKTTDLADMLEVDREQMKEVVKTGAIPVRRLGGERSLPMIQSSDITPDMILAIKAPLRRQSEFPEGELVYFIGSEGRFVKIGYSNKLAKRYVDLQCSTPYRLNLLATLRGGTRKDEKRYHHRFAEHRVVGEWFNLHADIKEEIDQLRQPHAAN